MTRTYLYNHVSPETAYVVTDYPWGYRLRTSVRYWIETKKAKNGGQRFVKQTLDPRSGKWCAPKYGTYSSIEILYLDENEHVQVTCLRHDYCEERILEFKDTHLPHMDEFQKDQLREILAYAEVMKHVTWSVGPRVEGGEEDQKEVESQICRAINCHYNQNKALIV